MLQQQVETTTAHLGRVNTMKANVERAERVEKTLSDARDVFHRDSLPSIMARRYVGAIDQTLDRFLQLMHADFTAGLEKDDGAYHFRCLFKDATERDASCLSGGQKVRFCIAFLLAINEILSTRLGVLALDEPTEHLDQDGKQHLVDVLSYVQQYARSSGTQIFCITHEAQLMGSFDQTICLSGGKVVNDQAA